MGFRFRKSINLGNGFKANVSKSGVGFSWGVKGLRLTRTAKGKNRATVSLPGTGISYVKEFGDPITDAIKENKKASSQKTKTKKETVQEAVQPVIQTSGPRSTKQRLLEQQALAEQQAREQEQMTTLEKPTDEEE